MLNKVNNKALGLKQITSIFCIQYRKKYILCLMNAGYTCTTMYWWPLRWSNHASGHIVLGMLLQTYIPFKAENDFSELLHALDYHPIQARVDLLYKMPGCFMLQKPQLIPERVNYLCPSYKKIKSDRWTLFLKNNNY